MPESLEELVAQTRRLSRPRPGMLTQPDDSRRRKESSLPNAAAAGCLPLPRQVDPVERKPAKRPDLLEDFTVFGDRIAKLMAEAEARRTRRKRCTPFVSAGDGQVILKPSRPRERRFRNSPRPASPDGAAGTLAALGIAILAFLAIATVFLSSPARKTDSRALARHPLPSPSVEDNGEEPATDTNPQIAAGLAKEPGS